MGESTLTVHLYRSHWPIGGVHRWRVVARNGKRVATSGEGYHNRSDCLDMVRKLFPHLYIVDES
jgi:uncharacterized protein YegP (UPF0339 family)